MKAVLVLDDGTQFVGEAIGAAGTCVGEIVFYTGMTGYQEVLTDTSCKGQIIAMTYPLIGNYGVNEGDNESGRPQAKGIIVRELCREPSNWRSTMSLDDYLKSHHIIGIQGIDTRALTRKLRDKGTMNGAISSDSDFRPEEWRERIKSYSIIKPVDEVTSREVVHYEGGGYRVALLDYGVRTDTVQALQNRGCEIYIFPANVTADRILDADPDGIMLSNGPGDPKDCGFQIQVIKELLGKKPVFGIGLGHQLAALANGGDTEKLKYGHRGGYPIKDLAQDKTYITSQNHGYAVLPDKLDPKKAVVSHINMNDNTVEGIRYLDTPTFTVQFYPQTSSGALETAYLFDEFVTLMAEFKNSRRL